MKAAREQDLVNACLMLLKLRGALAWRQNQGALTGTRGGKRLFVRFATMPGISDILAVLPPSGRLAAIECKVGRNKPTPQQAAFLAAVEAAGGIAAVVYDVGELARLLDGPVVR
jgi:hypothetical protein